MKRRWFIIVLVLSVFCFDVTLVSHADGQHVKKNVSIEKKQQAHEPPKKKKRHLVNKIVARVNGTNILQSTIQRRHLNAENITLEDAIMQRLYVQEAIKRKVYPLSSEVEKQISKLKSDYRGGRGEIGDEEFERALQQEGFTLKRYKQELAEAIAVASVMNAAVRDRVFISSQNIENYCKQHPEWHEEEYRFDTCIIPFEKAKTKKDLKKITSFDWVDSDWVKKSAIADHMSFVFAMKKGETSRPVKTQYGFQIVKLKDKKERRHKMVDERPEVWQTLRGEKALVVKKIFDEDLKKRALIEYL